MLKNDSPVAAESRSRSKTVVYSVFGKLMKKKKLPFSKETQKIINGNPILKNRTADQVRTWIHNQYKK